ncbi:hypothetical protein EV363DRAFT_1445610 [Boletus edulis]|nr:hypothetical protein EV363DRAFT_1445610 [Boletus edulis]
MDPPADPMDIDESANLEFVADDFEEGEHEKMDKDVFATFRQAMNPGLHSYILLRLAIVKQSRGRLLKKYDSIEKCEILLYNHPSINQLMLESSKDGYKKLRLLKLLRPEPVDANPLPALPETSWEHPYVGDAANALWDHIVKWFGVETGPAGRELYARYCAIVQSSGMGKSRVVDELSKFRFVIPVNLLDPESSGYPPSDISALRYLGGGGSQEEAFFRSCQFLHALFMETIDAVKHMAEETIAGQFRDNMKEGMGDRHGQWRVTFYNNVVQRSESLRDTYSRYFRGPGTNDEKLISPDFPLRHVFQELCKVHGQRSELSKPHSIPYVVLAFDEVHCLTGLTYETDHKWSRFGELRRAIRGLSGEPIFTVFLSTSAAMFSVTPTPTCDSLGRMLTSAVIPPFFDLGFDQLALPVDFSRRVMLSEIASEEHFVSYGRPLWRVYLKRENSRPINFAVMKLLGGVQHTNKPLDPPLDPAQKLACLAERIPIEFLSASFASQISEQEKYQVHAHMRVILNLKIDDNLETIVTTSPSEPILSEAAYSVMTTEGFNAPQALQEILKTTEEFWQNWCNEQFP